MVNDDSAAQVDKNQCEGLLDSKERIEAIEGIRRGLDSIKSGGGKTSEAFFKQFFANCRIRDE